MDLGHITSLAPKARHNSSKQHDSPSSSNAVRIEIDNDGATGGLTILLFVWIGIVLWSIALLIGAFSLLKVLNA